MKFLFFKHFSALFLIAMAAGLGICEHYKIDGIAGASLLGFVGLVYGICEAIYEKRSKK